MVVEKLFKGKWTERKVLYSLILGVIFSLLGFFTSFLLFKGTPNFIGITTVIFTVLISIPSINKLFEQEEMIETKGKKSFWKEHEGIIDFFQYFFLGVFLVFFIIGLINPNFILSEKHLFGAETDTGTIKKLDSTKSKLSPPPPPPTFQAIENTRFFSLDFFRIFKNNIYVMVIAFILSLFYGSGAIFLIVLNGSIFASELVKVITSTLTTNLVGIYAFVGCNLGIMFFHMVPEVGSYLIAAIAGGVLSKAIIKEKFMSERFKKVLKDSILLLTLSFIVLFFAALIEVKISKLLFKADVCINSKLVIITSFVLVVFIFLLYELFRKEKLNLKRFLRKEEKTILSKFKKKKFKKK